MVAVLPRSPPLSDGRVERPVSKEGRVIAPVRFHTWRFFALWAGLLFLALAVMGWFWRARISPVSVHVAPVAANLSAQVFGLGAVGADVQSGIGFKVSGIISEIDANEGDHVKAGQVLAQLDARDVSAQVAQAKAGVLQAQAAIDKAGADISNAQASLANAQALASRRSALVKSGFASVEESQNYAAAARVAGANLLVAQAELNTAHAGLAAAQAQQDYAEAVLANYTLRAPYDGWVLARNFNLGDAMVSGQAVFTLAKPRTIWVVGYVDERLAGRLTVGQPADITLRSESGWHFPGHVARIEIQSDSVNEERLVDVAFDVLPADIHLAEQAEISITTATLAHAVPVPPAAVTAFRADDHDGGSGTVWTIENGRLAQRQVTFGPQLLDGSLPVLSGLPQDARVVVSPQAGLKVGRAATAAKDASP